MPFEKPFSKMIPVILWNTYRVSPTKCHTLKPSPLCFSASERGFPTLVLVSAGQRYRFRGARSSEALASFALGGFLDSSKERSNGRLGWGEGEVVFFLLFGGG